MQQMRPRLAALAQLSRAMCSLQPQQLLAAATAGTDLVSTVQQACQQPHTLQTLCRTIVGTSLQQYCVQQPLQRARQQRTLAKHAHLCSSSSVQHSLQQQWALQYQQFQQLRHHADGVTQRRLLAAQQRRERQKELDERRAAAAAAGGQLQELPSAPSPADAAATAVAPIAAQPSEAQVSSVLNHPALIVTRAIEWGTLVLGFEQATKYTVYDQDGNIVALIAEQISGIGNEIQRQLLRTRRSFSSTVLSADGSQVVCRVRRPAYLINSYMYIEDPQGEVIGEVRQRWHLWRRNYDLYIGKRQFAAINGGLLAWEFELKDAQGATLALIDRNFLGFAKEIFTDAGKYVVHFGYAPQAAAELCTRTLQARSGKDDVAVTPLAQARTEVAVIPSITGNQLVVPHPLPLDERMVVLAAAISVDYNYFSPHSQSGGLINPPLFMPVPLPTGGMGGEAQGAATGGAAASTSAAGTEAAGAAGAAQTVGPAPDQQPPGLSGVNEGEGFSSGFNPAEFGAAGQAASADQPLMSGGGDDADSFRWDTGSSGGSEGFGGGGDDESASGLWGFIVGIWAMIFGE